jgi:hypothetical protein
MNRRQQERLIELNEAYQQEVTRLMEERTEAWPVETKPDQEQEPVPTPLGEEMRGVAPYDVNIKQVANGYIVHVGCQTFVFEKIEKATLYMEKYFNNPEETINEFYSGNLFK